MTFESKCYGCGEEVWIQMSPYGNMIPVNKHYPGEQAVPHEKTCPKRLRPLTEQEKSERETKP